MPDLSADRPLPLPEKQFTEGEIQSVAEALAARCEFGCVRRSSICRGHWNDARAVLEALVAADRLLPPDAEHREEYAVEWLTARGGIAMDRMQISSMGEAEHLGPKYVGQYNITDFRVVRRRWQHFSDGSAFAGSWVEVEGSTTE